MRKLFYVLFYSYVSYYYFFGDAPTHIGSDVLLALVLYCSFYKLYAPKPMKGVSHA